MQVSNRALIAATGGLFVAAAFGIGAASAADHAPNPPLPIGTAIARGAIGGATIGAIASILTTASQHSMRGRLLVGAATFGSAAVLGAALGAGFGTVRSFNHD